MYAAICLPQPEFNKHGFLTKDDAEKYIKESICQSCLGQIGRKYIVDGEEYEEDLFDTSCGAEWLVVKDEDYLSAKNTGELFDAAGFESITLKEKE